MHLFCGRNCTTLQGCPPVTKNQCSKRNAQYSTTSSKERTNIKSKAFFLLLLNVIMAPIHLLHWKGWGYKLLWLCGLLSFKVKPSVKINHFSCDISYFGSLTCLVNWSIQQSLGKEEGNWLLCNQLKEALRVSLDREKRGKRYKPRCKVNASFLPFFSFSFAKVYMRQSPPRFWKNPLMVIYSWRWSWKSPTKFVPWNICWKVKFKRQSWKLHVAPVPHLHIQSATHEKPKENPNPSALHCIKWNSTGTTTEIDAYIAHIA